MARKSTKRKVAAKTDAGVMGPEPSLPSNPTNSQISNALNWYHVMRDADDARNYVLEHTRLDKRDVKKINKHYLLTIGWIFRLASHSELPQELVESQHTKLEELVEKFAGNDIEDEKPKNVLSVQDFIKEKTSDLIGEIEGFIDDEAWDTSIYDFLTTNEVKPMIAKRIAEKYKPLAIELEDAKVRKLYHEGTKLRKFVSSILEDCERFTSNQKAAKPRKPRKRKAVSVDKQLSKLQYLKEDTDLKLVSIDPSKIIGAKQLWIYNVKYKKLTRFESTTDGFAIKGTTLQNVDMDSSETRRLRKPQETLTRVLDGGKIVLRKVLKELTTKPCETKTRIGKDTILLRALK